MRPTCRARAVLVAARAGHRRVVVPRDNADEAGLVEGIEVLGAATLGAVVAHVAGRALIPPHVRVAPAPLPPGPDLADVVGQSAGRRAGGRWRWPRPVDITCS